MTRPSSSPNAFLGLTGLLVIAVAIALAAAWPAVRTAAHAEADKLTREAAGVPIAEAAADYQLATLLDPANQSAYLGLARIQITAGHAEQALDTLDQAGKGSEASRLHVRTLLELGRATEATDYVEPLLGTGHTDDGIILAALVYALGNQANQIPSLTPLVASPETATRLARIQAGNLPLASELYASGLTESSRVLLVQQPTSFERNLLLARILYNRHAPADLTTATDFLVEAIALNPSDLAAHQLLRSVYIDQNQIPAAESQQILIDRLQANKP
ncbi:MAG TPA: hypothetical protein VMT30_00515 [Candidatus Saccharimonadia bacterium]|nr:hypothetical protein [Candidatus Saccharimonadia bacterium]